MNAKKIKRLRDQIEGLPYSFFWFEKMPKELQQLPESILEDYYEKLNDLALINANLEEETKKWVCCNQELVKLENVINKLLER